MKNNIIINELKVKKIILYTTKHYFFPKTFESRKWQKNMDSVSKLFVPTYLFSH